jgi:thioredoxin reductase (NADPH)
MNDKVYDVIVIGGGPAGLCAAQYAARANLMTVVLDKSSAAGALAYTGKIENYPGLAEPLSGAELLSRFRDQALKFGAEYVETQVTGVELDRDIKDVQTMDGVCHGRTVIIATGAMGRKPTIPGEEQYLGKGVSYCATCDGAFYRGLNVCVVGESEEALKELEVLTEFAKTVYLIAPSRKLASAQDQPPLNNDKVHFIPGHRLASIEGEDLVTKIVIKDMETGESRELDVDGVFIYMYGSMPVIDFINTEVSVNEKSCIVMHGSTETSVPGVYAAGDVTCGEVRQVIIAAAQGVTAALSAEKFIRQRMRIKPDWRKS